MCVTTDEDEEEDEEESAESPSKYSDSLGMETTLISSLKYAIIIDLV